MRRAILAAALALTASARAGGLIDFPTANHSLIEGRSGEFFMYVNRDFEGVRTTPWEGGQFGYVRGPKRSGGAIVFDTLHEGIDIRPLRRDPSGNPLDPVLAAADGTIAYVNTQPGASNYGRYIVIEHRIEGSPFYSLYAHLASASVAAGDAVRQGQAIGGMGYSGSGIDRARAHVHFEFALMLSPNFTPWHAAVYPSDDNPHGIYNGRNLVGIDPADLIVAIRAKAGPFSLRAYLRSQEAYFSVAIPSSPHLHLLRTYPWLADKGALANPPAWIISFSRYGVPVRAVPSPEPVSEPRVTWVRSSAAPYSRATRGIVTGPAGSPVLSQSGQRMAMLLTMAPAAPAQ